jgi:glycosyltransferase involved in cell wall biosynthesis
MNNYPKILVIGIDPFNSVNSSGITLSNLFQLWDKERIAQVYMSDMKPEAGVCNKFFKLNPKVVFFDYYFRKLIFRINRMERNTANPAAVTLSEENNNLRNKIHLNARAIADFSPFFLPSALFKWINEFNPDLIYSALGSARTINLTNTIAARIKKPITPHFMDDWPSTLYTQNELGGLALKIFKKGFNKLISGSNGGLCISELMADEYQKRYQIPFTNFSNCVDDNLFFPPGNQIGNEFIIMYSGGLHLNRWESLLDISRALEKLNKDGKKIVLKIHCSTNDMNLYAQLFQNLPSTKFEGSLNSDQVINALKGASLLLHVESFQENYVNLTRYSLSTKIPQYMAAGKPILAYGPQSLASIQHILKTNAGQVVCEKNIELLIVKISELYENEKLLLEYATNGFTYAKKYYSKSLTIELLKATLGKYSKS